MAKDGSPNTNWSNQDRSSQGTFMTGKEELGDRPIAANFHVEVDAILRDKAQMPNRAEYIRVAVLEKMLRDGLLKKDPGNP